MGYIEGIMISACINIVCVAGLEMCIRDRD